MLELPAHLCKKSTQAIHIVALPLSFFAFMLIYRPFRVDETMLLGDFSFGVNLTLISCILLGATALMRLLFYLLRRRIDRLTYLFWVLLEMVVSTFFVALYAWLMERMVDPYFWVVARVLRWIIPVMILPYTMITLSLLLVAQYRSRAAEPEEFKLRFYDERKNLKLVVAASSVLYIAAEENYINVHYDDGGELRSYLVRASMRSIEELCASGGLLRCHRSYYLNPLRVKVLRKEREGAIFAELDQPNAKDVPVTKRYYEQVAAAI